VKEYFPVSVVVETILETYQTLLSVKFFQVKEAKLWHPNATQWAVWDSDALADGRAEKGDGFLGCN
jgi:Zn-dependent oligopeptidase